MYEITTSEQMRIFELANTHGGIYFSDCLAFVQRFADQLLVIDLQDAMKPGKSCTRWSFGVDRWHAERNRLCTMEYVEMAAPECETVAELIAHLRAGRPLLAVDGLTVEISDERSTRTFSPFAKVKAGKLGERLNAASIAKAILSGQIIAARTDLRLTDDYAMDSACDFYAGDLELTEFAREVYEHPSGWRFWWDDSDRSKIRAACHTFDYKTLTVAPAN